MEPDLNRKTAIKRIEEAFYAIGYERKLVKRNYAFTDFISPDPMLRSITLAVFGQEPTDYRSACFGVEFTNEFIPSASVVSQLRAFGAPQFFLIRNEKVERWINREEDVFFQDEIATSNLTNLIERNAPNWSPENMMRIKSGFQEPKPQQLDFVDVGLLPALENQASIKIDSLMGRILYNAEKECEREKVSFDTHTMFNIVFRLFTAKLLIDRDILTAPKIDLTRPWAALGVVSKYYGEPEPTSYQTKALPQGLLEDIAREIHNSFSLRNLSVDTLAYVYENTFVSQKGRRRLGIHSTPPYIAEYILNHLPIESMPRSKWQVLDPMCGHGIFLIAAMRRLRNLLPSNWSGEERHHFFSQRLHGIEIDTFAAEVARLCLTLADFPESDGWDLKIEDVFEGESLATLVSKASIIIGNPPFEAIEGMRPEILKPKELLRRILPEIQDGAFLGFVLPCSFLDGSDYLAERRMFREFFEVINITTLPDRIFKYSDAETTLFLARKGKSSIPKTICRQVRESDRDSFRLYSTPTFEDTVPSGYFEERLQGRFLLPRFREIWERLEGNPRLKDIAEIKTGVQYEPGLLKKDRKQIVQERAFPNAAPGIFKVTNGFQQFSTSDVVYMSTKKEHRRKMVPGAWEFDWQKPKVVTPKSRMSRGPWRFAAVVDKKGLIVRRRFFAIWPKKSAITVEFLAAILNSPVAQAFAYTHSNERNTPKRVYGSIPVPFDSKNSVRTISELVIEYLQLNERGNGDNGRAKEILLEIDFEVLRLYDLPIRLVKYLLDIFSGYQRPVPFEFKGYDLQNLPSLNLPRDLPEVHLTREVTDFCAQKGISEYLKTALNIVYTSFPSIRNLHLFPEQDPETEAQWLLIDITVDGTADDILRCYDYYADLWVSSVPRSAREFIRLSYDIY